MNYRAYNGKAGHIGGTYMCNKYRHNSNSEVQRKTCTAHYTPYVNIHAATVVRLNMMISANLSEEEIVRMLSSDRKPLEAAQKALDKLKRRSTELDRIIRKIVEQNALGDITPETFTKLYSGYITEQNELTDKMKVHETKLAAENRDRENAQLFVEQIKKYTVSDELSRDKVLDLIDKIIIYEPSGTHKEKNRQQEIEFHYRFIGRLPDSRCSL
jgi:hypothetical protein